MEHILSMACPNNLYEVHDFQQMSGASRKSILKFVECLRWAMAEADSVFVFRSHDHLQGHPSVIDVANNIGIHYSPEVLVHFKQHNRILKIRAIDGGPIFQIHLSEAANREVFANAFKISIRDFKRSVPLCDEMLIDDPVYDQFDYLFVKEGRVILWTDIHELLLFKVN